MGTMLKKSPSFVLVSPAAALDGLFEHREGL